MFDLGKLPVNKFVVVGSFASNYRIAKDIDIVCYRKDINVDVFGEDAFSCWFTHQNKKIECLLADDQKSYQWILGFYEYAYRQDTGNSDFKYSIIHQVHNFALKAGHINYDHVSWQKHIHDYHALKNHIDVEYKSSYTNDLIELHKESTEMRFGKQKLPRLRNKTVGDFFDDGVDKYINHDYLHTVFKHEDVPMYQKMQKNLDIVDCDQVMWNAFTHRQKIAAVLEEVYVIATERLIIPSILEKCGYDDNKAFMWALKRVCTTLTQGWFRQFAVDNYFEIINLHNPNFFKDVSSHLSEIAHRELSRRKIERNLERLH